jgi:hypothetical protein
MRMAWTVVLAFLVTASASAQQTRPEAQFSITPDGRGRWCLGCPIANPQERGVAGSDRIGDYHQTTIRQADQGVPLTERIRSYDKRPATLFSLTYQAASDQPLSPFPVFDELPRDYHVLCFDEKVFAPPRFGPAGSGGPWVIFNDAGDTFIISPASNYLIQTVGQDAKKNIVSRLRDTVRNIPAGFTQQTLVVSGRGINRTWEQWGEALRDLQGKPRPGNEADVSLKYLGYWTDNGTDYYYNYDPKLGYAGTLLELFKHFRTAKIPVKYLQLDSWWYEKSLTGPDGKTGKTKNPKLPAGDWNRYGGLLEYRADPEVFPGGLKEFQRELGVPLIAHNRWIDPASPYVTHYRVEGYAATDPRWWHDIEDYLHGCGVAVYEQDWLSEIYLHSPALAGTVDAGDEFLDSMAGEAAADGMTMQYCMAFPCFFMQGSTYPNLTTIRTSDDRLKRDRWHNFLFTSRLASALGIWPWTDGFLSSETANILLSDLSAGPVGFGDKMGMEDHANIDKAVRADGVIVKPDAPIVPVDSAYVAEANHQHRALVASTFTDHDGIKTWYVLAFADRPEAKPDEKDATISLGEIGVSGPAYAYDFFRRTTHRVEGSFTTPLDGDGVSYFIIAQPGVSGIALFGDAGKFVSDGKQRIASLRQEPGKLTAQVLFAAGETSVTLHGCCHSRPTVRVENRKLNVTYDPASKHFSVEVSPPADAPAAADQARRVVVEMQSK